MDCGSAEECNSKSGSASPFFSAFTPSTPHSAMPASDSPMKASVRPPTRSSATPVTIAGVPVHLSATPGAVRGRAPQLPEFDEREETWRGAVPAGE